MLWLFALSEHLGAFPLPAHASDSQHLPACAACYWPEQQVTEPPWQQCRAERGDNLLCTNPTLLAKADAPLWGKRHSPRLEWQAACLAPHPAGYACMTSSVSVLLRTPFLISPLDVQADFGTAERKFEGGVTKKMPGNVRA